MGCGAGTCRPCGGGDFAGGMGKKTVQMFKAKMSKWNIRDSADPFEGHDLPDGIVLAAAKRPDWASTDYFVFENKDHMNNTLLEASNQTASRLTINAFADDDDSDDFSIQQSWAARPTSKSSNKSKSEEEKGGRFYSKRQECVGTWKITGNVLTLVWPFSMRTDTVVCIKTERQWVNQQTNLTLDVLEPKDFNPDWFKPDLIAEKFQCETVSSKAFECPVCFFELFKFPAGVIRLHSRRCCGHYFHKDCAQFLLKSKKGTGRPAMCPTCGVTFSEVKPMPDLANDPRDWFAVCDVDFGGELDAYEVVEALGCVLPVNRKKLEKNVKAHWREWDPDGDGTITLQEFIRPGNGLKDWLMNNLNLLRADLALKANTIPSIDRNPREWFHYWDRDASGTLEKDEVVRALIRTFCRDENGNPNLERAHDMREVADELWHSLEYSPFDTVTFEEFVRPYGLMDQFLHNQTHTSYFGMDAERIA